MLHNPFWYMSIIIRKRGTDPQFEPFIFVIVDLF